MAQKGEKQRMLEVAEDEMWTDFLEQANDLLLQEKAVRHENDHIKSSEICTRIVITYYPAC